MRFQPKRVAPSWGWLSVLMLAGSVWGGGGALTVATADVRTAKVAGAFYPQERAKLLELVRGLLERQPQRPGSSKPRILLVPHAGYQYSGPIAAKAFSQLTGHAYDGVVVVGVTHRLSFSGSSVDTRDVYETPLGELPVDQEAAAVLLTFPGIAHVEEAHESGEHSLEVELPFLQVALGGFKLVPILMGSASLPDAKRLAEALAGLAARGDYLFVFSTDLSHDHPYREAQAIDERTVTAVLFETPQAAARLFASGQIEACGQGPILTSLWLAAKLGYPVRALLAYANSGDTAGDSSRVVGYAAIAMSDSPPPSADRLSDEAGEVLVRAASATLHHTIGRRMVSDVPLDAHPELAAARGLFVTLRKRGELRGCIGRIHTDQPLRETIGAVALDAALRDGRFEPVRPDELDGLHVEVSVLTPPTRIQHAREIVAGRDGVLLDSQGHSGVFLPTVWDETGWTRAEFLRELASQKAGLPPDAWQQATLSVFQAQVFEER